MRWALSAGLVLLLGCGAGQQDAGTGPTPSASPGWVRESAEWFLIEISEEGRSLGLVYTMSGVASDCQREGGVEVEETEERVVVRAYREVDPAATVCTEELAIANEEVTLETPLGGRALLGCLPGSADPAQDETCRDLDRGAGYRPPPNDAG